MLHLGCQRRPPLGRRSWPSARRNRRLTGAQSVALASEPGFQGLFPGCEVGAMPPFGNLYGLPVWVAEELKKDPTIVFNAGTHREAIRLPFADFERLARPEVGPFAAR